MTNLVLNAAAGGSNMTFLIMMVAIFAIMWFFMIRPQQKKQKEIRKFQNALAGVPRWLQAAVFMALLSVLTLRLIPLMLR